MIGKVSTLALYAMLIFIDVFFGEIMILAGIGLVSLVVWVIGLFGG